MLLDPCIGQVGHLEEPDVSALGRLLERGVELAVHQRPATCAHTATTEGP